jgi:hypothetical protein
MNQTPYSIARTVLIGLFGEAYSLAERHRLHERFAEVCGEPRIAEPEDVFDRFHDIFGGGRSGRTA